MVDSGVLFIFAVIKGRCYASGGFYQLFHPCHLTTARVVLFIIAGVFFSVGEIEISIYPFCFYSLQGSSLNPCFNGRWSRTQAFEQAYSRFLGLKKLNDGQYRQFKLIYCIHKDRMMYIKNQAKKIAWLERGRVSEGYPRPRIAKVQKLRYLPNR